MGKLAFVSKKTEALLYDVPAYLRFDSLLFRLLTAAAGGRSEIQ